MRTILPGDSDPISSSKVPWNLQPTDDKPMGTCFSPLAKISEQTTVYLKNDRVLSFVQSVGAYLASRKNMPCRACQEEPCHHMYWIGADAKCSARDECRANNNRACSHALQRDDDCASCISRGGARSSFLNWNSQSLVPIGSRGTYNY